MYRWIVKYCSEIFWWLYIVAVFIFISSAVAHAQQAVDPDDSYEDWFTRWVEVGTEMTFSWGECNEHPVTYEIEILLYPSRVKIFEQADITELSFKWTPPRPGHYIIRARSRWVDPTIGTEPSEWIEAHAQRSMDPEITCGDPAEQVDWLLYAEIPAPTDGGIE